MTARPALMPLLIATVLGAVAFGAAEAAPIAYRFAGEMTEFTPPVSDPGPPPPVPPDLRLFGGGFDYDADAASGPVSAFHMSFAGGPNLIVVPETDYLVQARIFDDLFLVDLGVRELSIDGGFPDTIVSFQFQRPLAPGDMAGVLPPDLDGFTGSFVGATLLGQFFLRGTLDEFTRDAAVIPEPAAALLLASIGTGWFVMRALRRRRPV